MVKGFIFDLDGVIVDTARFHFLAWKRLANQLGIKFTEEDNERLKGVSRMTSLDILLDIGKKDLSNEEKQTYAEKKNIWYREYILKMQPEEVLPGVKEFLKKAKTKGIKLAIGSASKNAVDILKQIKIIDTFDTIIDGTKVKEAKPNPEVFLKGAEGLNLKPSQCIVFEDASAGIEAALNAGMKCIGIGNKETLAKAHLVIKGFDKTNPETIIEKLNT